jgi:hypothetical protein
VGEAHVKKDAAIFKQRSARVSGQVVFEDFGKLRRGG